MRRVPPWFKKFPNYKQDKIKIGVKKAQKHYDGYISGWVKPGDRLEKRRASKRVRRALDVPNGNHYKKCWDYFEWS